MSTDSHTATFIVAATSSLASSTADYVADGSNDEATIQAAIDALPADGGVVHLLEGYYGIEGQIDIDREGVVLQGSGAGTVLRVATGTNGTFDVIDHIAGSGNSVIRDLAIDGNKAGQTSGSMYGIRYTADGATSTIYNVSIKNTLNSSIYIDDDYYNILIDRVTITNDGDSNDHAVYIDAQDFHGITITNSTFDNVGSAVLSTNTGGTQLKVVDNHFSRLNRSGVEFSGTVSPSITDVIIADNTFDTQGLNAGAVISAGQRVRRVTVANNIIKGSAHHGISLSSGHSSIIGNTIDTTVGGISGDGINIGSNPEHILIADNVIGTTTNAGDGIDARGDYITIIGNTIVATDDEGIRFVSGDNVVISGNIVRQAGIRGIQISSVNNFSVNNNIIVDTSFDAIEISSSAYGTINDNQIDEVGAGSRDGMAIASTNDIVISGNHIYDAAGSSFGIDLASTVTRAHLDGNVIVGDGWSNEIDDDSNGATYLTNNRIDILADTADFQDGAYTAFTVTQLGTGSLLDLVDADGTSSTTVFTVLDGGNVGIGSSSPNHPLTVYGLTELWLNDEATNLRLNNQNFASTSIQFYSESNNLHSYIASDPVATVGASLIFYHNTNGSDSAAHIFETDQGEHMRISGVQGFVGIGTSSPYANLSVHAVDDSGAVFVIASSSNGTATTTLLTVGALGTTTAANGFNITDGCFAINGTCLATGGGGSSFGTDNQVPFTNSGGTDFDYSGNFTFDGSLLQVIGRASTTNLTIGGQLSFSTTTTTGSPLITLNGNALAIASSTGFNTSFGETAFDANTGGVNNSAFGHTALTSNTVGSGNTALGYSALGANTTGNTNTAIGTWALSGNIAGFGNVAIGQDALAYATSSATQNNVAVGNGAVACNAGAGVFCNIAKNIGIGSTALGEIMDGSSNIGIGYAALGNATNTTGNIGIGEAALELASGVESTANFNIGLGYAAGLALETGDNNILIGYQAGNSLTTGGNNIVVGYDVEAPSNTTSNQLTIGNLIFGTGLDGTGTTLSSGNVGIGTTSPFTKFSVAGSIGLSGQLNFATTTTDNSPLIVLSGNTFATASSTGFNTSFGENALDAITSGVENTAFGSGAATNLTGGVSNTAIGSDALSSNDVGNFNVALGYNSLSSISGSGAGANIGIGVNTLSQTTYGEDNVSIGYRSGTGAGTKSRNIFIGTDAGGSTVDADNNILIGHLTGDAITTGDNNLLIGYNIDAPSSTANNQLSIGNLIFGTGVDGTGTTVSSGNIGIGTSSPQARLTVASNGLAQTWSQVGTSTDVSNIVDPAIAALTPNRVAYMDLTDRNLKVYEFDGHDWSQVGANFNVSGAGDIGMTALSPNRIAFLDPNNTDLRVYEFDGNAWSQIGNDLTVSEGTPALAALTPNRIALMGATSRTISTYDFDGADWSLVGTSTVVTGSMFEPTVTALSPNRVAYIDGNTDDLRVYEFDGYEWSQVGNDFNLTAFSPRITALSPSRIALFDDVNDNLRVFEFDGADWSEIGTVRNVFFSSDADITALSSNRVAFIEENSDDLRVYQFSAPLLAAVDTNDMPLFSVSDTGVLTFGGSVATTTAGAINFGSQRWVTLTNDYETNNDNTASLQAAFHHESIFLDRVGIGTSTPSTTLHVDGLFYVSGNGTSTFEENLLVKGTLKVGTSSVIITEDGIQATNDFVVETSNFGVGTTTPNYQLTVDGTAMFAGAIYDNNYSAGTNGYVMQTTGSGVQWVATSSLGLSGATSISGLSDAFVNSSDNQIILGHSGGSIGTNDDRNTAVGITALDALNNSTGIDNTAVGFDALTLNTSGDFNTAIGSYALNEANSERNTAIGYQAGFETATGTGNDHLTAVGYHAGYSSDGDRLTAVGVLAGFENQGGFSSALGWSAAYQNTGDNLSALGMRSGYQNAGDFVVAIGTDTGRENTSDNLVALGSEAARYRNAASSVLVGHQAGYGSDLTRRSIANSTFLGYRAGYAITTGNNNLLLGYNTGNALTSGSNNIAIGYDIDLPSNTASNQLTIGNAIFGLNIDATNATVDTNALIGIATNTPDYTLTVDGSTMLSGALYDNNYSAGTNGFVLQSTGAGINWVATSSLGISSGSNLGGGLQSVQVFTSSSTWTKPAGIDHIRVIVVGGGGGGGHDEAGGGGAGGVAIEWIDVTATGTVPVTVGGGGAGDSDSGGSGVAGATSSFGTFLSASGGLGGNSISASPPRIPGDGGVGSGGDINIRGGAGGTNVATYNIGGSGGSNAYGGGGRGGEGTSNGEPGGLYGGGGGGSGGGSGSGGDGADGVVIVYEYQTQGLATGTIQTGTQGQIAYYGSAGTDLLGTSSLHIATNGYIGIGTTSPASRLHVAGNQGDHTAVRIQDEGTGGETWLLAATNDSNPFGGGNFGLFNTTENDYRWLMRDGELDLNSVSSESYVGLELDNNNTGGRSYILASTDNANSLIGGGKWGVFDNNDSAYRLVVDSTGDVGIGTTSPASLLDVYGDFQVGTSGIPTLFVDVSTDRVGIGTGTPSHLLHVHSTGDETLARFTSAGAGAGIDIYRDDITNGGSSKYAALGLGTLNEGELWSLGIDPEYSGDEDFFIQGDGAVRFLIDATTNNVGIGTGTSTPASKLQVQGTGTTNPFSVSSSSGSSLFTITHTGNVGIGTTTPSADLHIESTQPDLVFNRSGGGTANTLIEWQIDGTTTGFFGAAGTADGGLVGTDSGDIFLRSEDGYDLLLGTDGGTARLTVVDGGNVGIGTTSPSSILHIENSVPELTLNRSGGGTDSGRIKWQIDGVTTGFFGAAGTADGGLVGTDSGDIFLRSEDGYDLLLGTDGGTARMVIADGGNVGIATTTPTGRFTVEGGASDFNIFNDGDTVVGGTDTIGGHKLAVHQSASAVVAFNRTTDDGGILNFYQDGIFEGGVSVSGNTITYGAFTGAHYASTTETIERGKLVAFTGTPYYKHGEGVGEPVYTVTESITENSDTILGAMMALQEPSQPLSESNPYLVMAVGNGDLWVADQGADIATGDFLISSDIAGHAELEDGTHPVAHVIARAAEPIDWSTVTDTVGGVKHKKISVTFELFERPNGLFTDEATGFLGIGTTTPAYELDVDGSINVTGSYLTDGADYAEYFYTNDTDLLPGEVVCLDLTEENAVERCTNAHDSNVMGIISTKPAFLGNATFAKQFDPHQVMVAMLGQIPAKVSDENGEVRAGDSLTSASLSGYVMKADPGDATVAVALENLDSSAGEIQVLISRRNQSLTVEEVEQEVTERIATMEIEDEVQIMLTDAIDELNLDEDILAIVEEELQALDISTEVNSTLTIVLRNLGLIDAETEISSTTASSTPESTPSWMETIVDLVVDRVTALLETAGSGISGLFAEQVTTNELCVGDVCVNEAVFLQMVQQASSTDTTAAIVESESGPEPAPVEDSESDSEEDSNESTPPVTEPEVVEEPAATSTEVTTEPEPVEESESIVEEESSVEPEDLPTEEVEEPTQEPEPEPIEGPATDPEPEEETT